MARWRLATAATLCAIPATLAIATPRRPDPSTASGSTRVALVAPGPHPYFAAWEQAGRDAQRDFKLGAADFKVPPSWGLSQQNDLVESLASQGYNAFLIFPGDPVGERSTVAELTDMNIPVIALAGCVQDPSEALFCLGTDVGRSAYLGTEALITAMGGHGHIVHLTGFMVDPNTKLRMGAVKRAVDETHGAVTLIQTIADIDAPEAAQDKIDSFLAVHAKQVDGVIATAWVPSVVAATALRKIGDKRIRMVGIDHDPVVLQAVQDGYLTGTMLQNPYGQAYIGSFAIARLAQGCTLRKDAPWQITAQTKHLIDSGTVFAGPAEVGHYLDSMRAITTSILAGFQRNYLNCP